jgi:hypothetical protein
MVATLSVSDQVIVKPDKLSRCTDQDRCSHTGAITALTHLVTALRITQQFVDAFCEGHNIIVRGIERRAASRNPRFP